MKVAAWLPREAPARRAGPEAGSEGIDAAIDAQHIGRLSETRSDFGFMHGVEIGSNSERFDNR